MTRSQVVLSGPVEEQVREALDRLIDRGALARSTDVDDLEDVGPGTGIDEIGVLLQPDRPEEARELLGGASALGGRVIALGAVERAGAWGADEVVVLAGSTIEEDVAAAVRGWCEARRPWALLGPGTIWGREVMGRVAAGLGAGLTGDAIDLGVEDGRLVGWKPAFGGQLVAAITSSSPTQMVTIRPGMLPLRRPRSMRDPSSSELSVGTAGRVVHLDAGREDDLDDLARAAAVVGVGTGVDPSEYPLLAPLLAALGAELAATRKVTDKGWQPRSRQIGITGRSISPVLYVAIGVSGKFNHMVGVRGAGAVLAINPDPSALVFQAADVGIVADWHEAVPLLAAQVGAAVG